MNTTEEQMPSVPGASLNDVERYVILKTLASVNGSTRKTAKILGVSVRTIQNRMRGWGLGRKPSGALEP